MRNYYAFLRQVAFNGLRIDMGIANFLKVFVPVVMVFSTSLGFGQTNIFNENFAGYSNGTTSSSKWSISTAGCNLQHSNKYFEVRSNRMEARHTQCEVVWYSSVLTIDTVTDASISIDYSRSGNFGSNDYIAFYYVLDGGAETLFSTNGYNNKNFGSGTATQTGLNGTTLQIVVRTRVNGSPKYTRFDNVGVEATPASVNVFPTLSLDANNPTCNGGSNGSVTVLGVSAGAGSCASAATSPYDCNSCTQTLSGGGWNTINAGTTACILAGQTYTGGLSINGGTVIVCGTLSPSSLSLNSGVLAVNGTFNFNGWLSINGTTKFYNYGTSTISGGIGVNKELYNYGTLSCGSGMQINSNSVFLNDGTLDVTGNFEDNFGSTNNGTITTTGNFTKNSNGSFTNNCTVIVGGNLVSNAPIYQNGTMEATGSLTVNGSGALHLGGGSFTSAASCTLNGSISNVNADCAKVSIAGNTTINGSGSISGKTDYCDANGIETNWGSINAPATTDCSCGATGAGGPAPTYAWSTGATTNSISGLVAGNYSVTVTIGNDSEVLSATLTAPSSINITPTPIATSGGSNNGSISLVVTGGTSPYSYAWSNGASVKDISSLAAGSYTVTVTDAASCTATATAIVAAPSGPCTCRASGNWSDPTTWTGNCSGGGGRYAGADDEIVIQGYQVTVDSTHAVKALYLLESGSATTRLSYTNSNTLDIINDFNITTTNSGNNVEIEIDGAAEMIVDGDLVINHTRGTDVLIELNSNNGNDAKLRVNGNLDMTMSGSSDDLFINAHGANNTIMVVGDILFNNNRTSSSADMIITMASSSKLIVGGDINFNGVRSQNMELILNNSSVLELQGSITRNQSPSMFGKVSMNSSSSLIFSGSEPQYWERSTGNSDNNTYKSVVIRNTSDISPQVIMTGDVTITNSLILEDGNIGTNGHLLTVTNTSANAVSGHSANSYVVGTLRRYISSNNASYDFPLGYGAPNEYYWARITNNYMIGPSYLTATFGELPVQQRNNAILVSDAEMTYTELKQEGIWTIDPNTQPLLGSYKITVGTENFDGLMDNMFRVIKRPTGSGIENWSNGGGLLSILGAVDRLVSNGVTSLGGLTSFSEFGIAQGGGESLPIDLVSFGAMPEEERVRIDWTVSMEINNDYFTIERSLDGVDFEPVAVVQGGGNHAIETKYQTYDENPEMGLSYYRLRQTDFDGKFKVYDMVSVSMTSNVSTSFNIYPNPNKGSFTVALETPFDKTTLMVLNGMGQMVYYNELLNTTGKTNSQLDLSNVLAAGIYFVKVDTGTDTFIKQMVIE